MYNVPNDREREALKRIATAINGTIDGDAKGNIVAYTLEVLAAWFEEHTMQTAAELPAVTAADNGATLKVIGGKWQAGTDQDTIPGKAAYQADTTSELGAVVSSFNALLAALKAAGLMETAAETPQES